MGIWPSAPWGQHAAPQTPAEEAKGCEVLWRISHAELVQLLSA